MSGKEMSFWEHFDALRSVLLRIAAVIVVLGIAAFCFMPSIFDNVILAPCHNSFPFYRLLDAISAADLLGFGAGDTFDLHLISVELTSQIYTHISASCWIAVIVGFPIIIFLLWTFVSPALYEREKRGLRKAFFWGNLMFYLGVCAGYFLVFPLILRFLATYSLSGSITPMITLDSYMDNFFTLILIMGAVFELPLLAWLLGRLGILTRRFFKRYRRHAIVGLMATAGFITPTGDPFTLLVVFIPIYALWELSARLVPPGDATTDND